MIRIIEFTAQNLYLFLLSIDELSVSALPLYFLAASSFLSFQNSVYPHFRYTKCTSPSDMRQLYATLKYTEPFKGAATARNDFLWDFARNAVVVKVAFNTLFAVQEHALKPSTDEGPAVDGTHISEEANRPVNDHNSSNNSSALSASNALTFTSKRTSAAAKQKTEAPGLVQSPVAKPSKGLQEAGLVTPAVRPPPRAPPSLVADLDDKEQQPLAIQVLKNSSWGSGSVSSEVSSLLLDLENGEDNESTDNDSCFTDEQDEGVDNARSDRDVRDKSEVGAALAANCNAPSGHFMPLTPNNLDLLNRRRRQHNVNSKKLKWNPVDAFSSTTMTADECMPWPKVRAIAEAAADALATKKKALVKQVAAPFLAEENEEKEEKENAAHVTDSAAGSHALLPLSSEQVARSIQNRRAARIRLLDNMQLTSPSSAFLEATFVKPNDSSVLSQQSKVTSSKAATTLAPTLALTTPVKAATATAPEHQVDRAKTFASHSSSRSNAGEYNFSWMQRDAGMPHFRLNATPTPRSNSVRQVTHLRKRPFSFCDHTNRTPTKAARDGRNFIEIRPWTKRARY
jgi:hypothetical protein